MDELIKPRMEEEKSKILQNVKEEALETALATVKAKLKEEQEAAAAAKELETSRYLYLMQEINLHQMLIWYKIHDQLVLISSPSMEDTPDLVTVAIYQLANLFIFTLFEITDNVELVISK